MTKKIIPAGTKIVIGTCAGYAGTDNMAAYILSCDYTESELDEIAHQDGLDWAESYGVYPYPNGGFDEDDEGSEYSDNIEGWWELYDEEQHAGNCSFGNGVMFNEL